MSLQISKNSRVRNVVLRARPRRATQTSMDDKTPENNPEVGSRNLEPQQDEDDFEAEFLAGLERDSEQVLAHRQTFGS